MNLRGNTIFITGGGSGIGRGLAEAFHKLGNQVIIGGRRREALDRTVAANPGMAALVFDVTNPGSISAGARQLIAAHPDLNVVINNAGVQYAVDFASVEPIDEDGFSAEIDTNVYGVLRVTAAFLPHLKTRPAATIVNISSGLAYMPLARYAVYCATKAFVHSFSVSLRHQLRRTGVRVVELAPPWVATELGGHPAVAPTDGRPGPMPLDDFIAAAMAELATDAEELHIGTAQSLYAAAVNEGAGRIFARMNP